VLKHKFYGLYVGAGIALITLLLSLLGAFSLPNILLYDVFTSYTPASEKKNPKVLLIAASEQQRLAGDELWLPIILSLEDLGAHQISFTFFPENTSSDFYRQTAQLENVVFAQKAINTSKKALEQSLVPVPEAAIATGVHTAVSIIRQSSYGVNRRQLAWLELDGQRVNPFEMEVARQFTGQLPAVSDESFLVDFIGGTGRIPFISLDKVLAGDLIPELVAGKSILIGSAEREDVAVSTPLINNHEMISSLVFHGYALETLLSDRVVQNADWYINAILIVLIVGASLLVFQQLGIGLSTWLTIILFVVYIIFAWVLLIYFRVWQPVVELGFAQFLTLLAFIQRKVTQDNIALRQVLLETSTKIRERVYLPSFYESDDPWSQVITMINQSLDLSRVILLDRVLADHRVKEVTALNCSVDDINEMRRDYERTPYSTAIAQNGPVIVSKYLSDVDYEETQYLVPLVHSGEVLGFWAFGISPDKVAAKPNFEAIVNDFGSQIAELLHYRRQWLSDQTIKSSGGMQRYLQLEGGEQAYQDLNKSISLVEMRLSSLEAFLDGLSTSAILYDLFGRVILVNASMVKLLENSNLAPYEMTALDLITNLTGLEAGKIRNLIENVVVERSSTVLPISAFEDSNKNFLLHISPLLRDSDDLDMSVDTSSPFNLSGILCELMDVTTVKNLSEMKESLVRHVSHRLYDDMSEIKALSAHLTDNSLWSSKQKLYLHMLQEKVDRSIKMIQQSNALLIKDLWEGEVESYPVDAKVPVETVIATLSEKAGLRGTTLQCDFPREVSLVFADKDEIRKLFNIILLLLIQDSAENTPVTVKIEEQDLFLVYTFANNGFGMPDERFQQYLYGSENITSDEFRTLRALLPHVKNWGGEFMGHSEVGSGINFTVKLRSFH